MAELKTECGILSRTVDILQQKESALSKTLVSMFFFVKCLMLFSEMFNVINHRMFDIENHTYWMAISRDLGLHAHYIVKSVCDLGLHTHYTVKSVC